MATGVHNESAKIYAFPTNRFQRPGFRPQTDLAAEAAAVVYDSCWYHDEAVRGSEEPVKAKFKPHLVD